MRRSSLILVVLALVTACSGINVPVAPVATNAPITPTPSPPPIVLGVAPPAGTYVFTDTGVKVGPWTRGSRFVLSDDGRFVLQYEGIGGYPGTYRFSEASGIVTFEFEGRNTAGHWGATGFFRDDVLSVLFNIVMQWADFDDASYTRVP